MRRDRLLEELAEKENCYISSLKYFPERSRSVEILARLDPEKYTLQEWEYCVSYLKGCPVYFLSYAEVTRYLKSGNL